MKKKRTDRLNSLLKEVISEVILREVKHPDVSEFTSVTQVDITKDLRFAKVSISVIGSDEIKKKTINALNQAAGFISTQAAKKVVLRYFPSLTFQLDTSVDKFLQIEKILNSIKKKDEH